MAFRLHDFLCPNGHEFEELIDTNSKDPVLCLICSAGPSTKLISAPRIDPRLGLDPEGFPTMGDKWARIRRERAKSEAKQNGE